MYRDGRRWFEFCIISRKVSQSVIRGLVYYNPQLQASTLLLVQFFYCMMLLQQPFSEQNFNYMELASAFSSLLTALCVTVVVFLFGVTTTGTPGLEIRGTAGAEEDSARLVFLEDISWAIVGILMVTGACLFLLTVVTFLTIVRDTIIELFRKKVEKEEEAVEEEQEYEPEPIAEKFEWYEPRDVFTHVHSFSSLHTLNVALARRYAAGKLNSCAPNNLF